MDFIVIMKLYKITLMLNVVQVHRMRPFTTHSATVGWDGFLLHQREANLQKPLSEHTVRLQDLYSKWCPYLKNICRTWGYAAVDMIVHSACLSTYKANTKSVSLTSDLFYNSFLVDFYIPSSETKEVLLYRNNQAIASYPLALTRYYNTYWPKGVSWPSPKVISPIF